MFSHILGFFKRAVTIKEVRKKIIITSLILVVFRLAAHVPAAGVDPSSLRQILGGNALFALLDIFSGGTLANFSIMALGVGPYITASIVIQLMTVVIPRLEELQKEGEFGQEKLNQYMRFLTLPLAVLQGFMMYTILRNVGILQSLSPIDLVALVSVMVAGTMFALWLGDLITEYGVGNGISFIIFGGIIARFPTLFNQVTTTITPEEAPRLIIFALLSLLVIAVVVFVTEAIRQIPVHYARRAKGATSSAAVEKSYLPLRVNQSGVIPIIFAISLVALPSLVTQFVSGSGNTQLAEVAAFVTRYFNPTSILYNLTYFMLIVGFTYFYTTSVAFNPEKIADSLKKNGGFIPGIRPGADTEKYLSYVANRVTLAGAVFLGLVAVLPTFFQGASGVGALAIGGTSLLIVVSVVLELTRTIESKMIMNRYDKYLRS